MRTTIQKVESGWTVKVTTDEGFASTNVTFNQYDEFGQEAFNQAIEFLLTTIKEGY